MPRYGMDIARTRHGYNRGMNFLLRKYKIRYVTKRYAAYFEVSGYDRFRRYNWYGDTFPFLCFVFTFRLCAVVSFSVLINQLPFQKNITTSNKQSEESS